MGTFLLAYAPSLGILQFSRVLVGIGSACAFMCALKIVVDYLSVGKRGFLMGATLTLGTLGAIVAGKPLASLADQVGWRSSVSYAACFGILILLFTILFLPRPRKELLIPASSNLMRSISTSLMEIFKTRAILIYSILAIGVYTPLSGLADLWGVAFLMQKYDLARTQAAEISMMMYFGLGIGCLILPWLSEKYHLLNRSIQFCAFGVLAIFALLLYGPSLSIFSLKICLALLGMLCGVEMLCFAGASRYTHARNVGTTLGVVNTLNMLGGGILQQLIGWFLDHLWTGKMDASGVRIYQTSEYTSALSILFVVILICCVMSLYLPKDGATDLKIHRSS
jgi:sugar phosphate permease